MLFYECVDSIVLDGITTHPYGRASMCVSSSSQEQPLAVQTVRNYCNVLSVPDPPMNLL